MSIRIFYDDTSFRYRGWRKAKKTLNQLILHEKKIPGDINIIVTTDIKLIEINRKFLEHDYYTDVITFNYNRENILNGEIYISADTVRKNAKEYKVSIFEEMKRVFIHGILHLSGYDDKTEAQKKIMKQMEDLWLGLGGN